jgi:hypothetical protein
MSIDTAALLAERYKSDPNPLKAAVLGQGTGDINPYAALRALQMQKDAERFMAAQAAMNGQQYQDQPSMVQQALNPTPPQGMPQQQMPQMPQQGMPQQQMQQPQGLEQMQQMQQPQQEQPSPGLEGMPAGDQNFAGGGIIAFAGADGSQVEDNEEAEDPLQSLMPSPGDPVSYSQFSRMLPGAMRNVARQQYVPMEEEKYKEAIQKRYGILQGLSQPQGTENPYAQFKTQLNEQNTARAQGLEQNKGMAMMAAAGDILQPGGLMRGLGAASKTFATQYNQAMTADKAEQRAIQSMQFNLADAERKERMGMGREALAAADQARKDHDAAQKFKLDKSKALATLAISGARATRPTGTGGAKEPKGVDAYAAAVKAYKLNPTPENRLAVEAYAEAFGGAGKVPAPEQIKAKEEAIGTTQGTEINKAMKVWESSRDAINAKREGRLPQARAAKEAELRANYPSGNKNTSTKGGADVNYSDLWSSPNK